MLAIRVGACHRPTQCGRHERRHAVQTQIAAATRDAQHQRDVLSMTISLAFLAPSLSRQSSTVNDIRTGLCSRAKIPPGKDVVGGDGRHAGERGAGVPPGSRHMPAISPCSATWSVMMFLKFIFQFARDDGAQGSFSSDFARVDSRPSDSSKSPRYGLGRGPRR
jgi:hypothetical protein